MKFRYILLTLLALCLLAVPAAAAGGAGTAANPYVIQTPAELQSIQNDLSAYYVLGNNLDMSGYNFVPIGGSNAPFFGTLDGQGYTISNLNINLPDQQYVGMFAVIGPGTQITNINFADCSVTGSHNVGTLYGRANGASGVVTGIVIENIDLQGCTVSAGSYHTGGIAGSNGGSAIITISDCDVDNCLVESTSSGSSIGGITGSLSNVGSTNALVDDCTVSHSEIRSLGSSDVGGIAGSLAFSGSPATGTVQRCTVSNCYIWAGGSNVGGICGFLSSDRSVGYVYDCVVEDCVIESTGGSGVGGICGSQSNTGSTGNVNDCVVTDCTVSAKISYAGGIAGCKYSAGFGNLSGNTVSGSTILASSYAGGICPTFTRT